MSFLSNVLSKIFTSNVEYFENSKHTQKNHHQKKKKPQKKEEKSLTREESLWDNSSNIENKIELTDNEKKLYSNCHIDRNSIEYDEELYAGKGSSRKNQRAGFIRLGFQKIPVTIKRVSIRGNYNRSPLDILRDIHLMAECKNENVLSVFGLWFTQNSAYIVQEYAEKGDLSYNLQKIGDRFNPTKKVQILLQIAHGLNSIHKKKVVHRHLSTQSLMIGNDGQLKLSNFKFAARISDESIRSGSLTIKKKKQSSISRSIIYTAPELTKFSPKETGDPRLMDIYSFGIIAWEVWSLKIPYFWMSGQTEEIITMIHKNNLRPNLEELKRKKAPEEFLELVQKCWKKNPKKRYQSMEEVIDKLEDIEEIIKDSKNSKNRKTILEGSISLSEKDYKTYRHCHIGKENVKFDRVIQTRATGSFHVGKLKIGLTTIKCIIKQIKINDINNTVRSVIGEIRKTTSFKHENIIQTYGLWFANEKPITAYVALEYCDLGNLVDNMGNILPELNRIDLMIQICRGLKYLHKMGIVHRNVNCSNILLRKELGELVVKITDFKGSKRFTDDGLDQAFGRPGYIPPETCGYGTLEKPELIDIYALGLIFWELFVGEEFIPPAGNWINKIHTIHRKQLRPPLEHEKLNNAPKSFKELIAKCWHINPKKRPQSVKSVIKKLKKIKLEVSRMLESRSIHRNSVKFGLDENDHKIIDECFIDKNYVEKESPIGQGAHGIVYKGKLRIGFQKIPIALKEVVISEEKTSKSILREIRILKECRNKNVLKCYGLYFTDSSICVVLELCSTDLYRILKKKVLSFEKKIDILLEIAEGVRYLHNERNIVHRDLKTLNVLIGKDKKMKISDFDTAKHQDSVSETVCGTPEYIAPELFGYVQTTNKFLVDVYSFGIISWEVFAQKLPYHEIRNGKQPAQLIHLIHSKRQRPNLEDIPTEHSTPELIELICSCWEHDPSSRPSSFDDIIITLKEIKEETQKKQNDL